MAKKHEIEIFLYGTNHIGYGWILRIDGRLFGDGDPKENRDCTRCLYEAKDIIYLEKGVGPKSEITIFAPGGELISRTSLANLGRFGTRVWEPANYI